MQLIDEFSRFYTDLQSMQVGHLQNIYAKDVEFIDPIASHNGLEAVKHYFSKLLNNAKFCEFEIHSKEATGPSGYVVVWTMRFTSQRINKGKPVAVDGLTVLRITDEKISYHRDYYDLGQMVYEHVPLLGRFIKAIKGKLS
ncbi:nuclear transport factor 2 family protein [Ningiella sp. W23]|uniref:nuclear transport factor 2 family protein n=1 Tax=Ningiella sp. W23 TaxID=3023715 RepID=UPI003757BB76